jgi:hypothetical protein
MSELDELARLLAAVENKPDPTPAEARARLHDVCNKESEAGWRRRLFENDPIAQLENARLRRVIAIDEIQSRIKAKAAELFPDIGTTDPALIALRVARRAST